jgi:uncharacterized protein
MHAVVDTGPLVAFFDRAERNHGWVVERIEELEAPLLVCEPVLTETMYLLARYALAQEALFELLQNGALNLAFEIKENIGALQKLMQKYRVHADVTGRRVCSPHGRNPRASLGVHA